MTPGDRNIISNVRREFTATAEERTVMARYTDERLLRVFNDWNLSDKNEPLWTWLVDFQPLHSEAPDDHDD